MWGLVVLQITDRSRTPYFTHGSSEGGRYCLTIYPEVLCICGQWRLKWVTHKEQD